MGEGVDLVEHDASEGGSIDGEIAETAVRLR